MDFPSKLFLLVAAIVFVFFIWIMPVIGTNPILLFLAFMFISAVVWFLLKYIIAESKKS
jgi:hypothetical protein